MRTRSILLVVAALGFRTSLKAPSGGRALTVAFVPKALNSPFWAAMEEAALGEAEAQGRELLDRIRAALRTGGPAFATSATRPTFCWIMP